MNVRYWLGRKGALLFVSYMCGAIAIQYVTAAEGGGSTNSGTEYYCSSHFDGNLDTGYQCDATGDGVKDSCFTCCTNGDGIPDACTVDLNGDGLKLECPIRCSAYDLPSEKTVSVSPPGQDVLDSICGAIRKCQIVQDCRATIEGTVELKKGMKCCDPNAYAAPVEYQTISGKVTGSAFATVVVPSLRVYWSDAGTSPIKYCVVIETYVGPIFEPEVSEASLGVSKTYDGCGTDCTELTGDVSVGLKAGFMGQTHALVQLFEEGHWYTVDTEVLAEVKATGGLTLGGSYAKQIGGTCTGTPAPPCGWLGVLKFDVTADFEAGGWTFSTGCSWTPDYDWNKGWKTSGCK